VLTALVPKPEDFETEPADGYPLYGQSSHIYYNTWYSPGECESTASGTRSRPTAKPR
jgi:hypothetical protein